MIYDAAWLKSAIARDRRRIANYGVWSGRGDGDGYFDRCRAYHQPTGTNISRQIKESGTDGR
jgi:hypothetical protein